MQTTYVFELADSSRQKRDLSSYTNNLWGYTFESITVGYFGMKSL
jgi:hypothetical protein